MKSQSSSTEQITDSTDRAESLSRRRFFHLAGGIAGAGALLSASSANAMSAGSSLGSGDTALLNIVLAVQQIEADFYTSAMNSGALSDREKIAVTGIKDQEASHLTIVKKMLGFGSAVSVVTNLSAIDFNNRESVLLHASIIEDIAVACVNGITPLLAGTAHQTALGKLALADAGHSTFVSNSRNPNTFGNLAVDENGLGHSYSPSAVLEQAEAYLYNRFDKSTLPNQNKI